MYKGIKLKNISNRRVLYIVLLLFFFIAILCNVSDNNDIGLDMSSTDRKVFINNSASGKVWEPELALRKGTYHFRIKCEDASGNVPFYVFSNDQGIIYSSDINGEGIEFDLELSRDEDNLIFVTSNAKNVNLKRVDIKSNSLMNTDVIFASIVVLLFGCILYLLRFTKFKDSETLKTSILLIMLGLSVSFSSFLPYIIGGHDQEFHILRIMGIENGIMNGQFPVRNYPSSNNGYGFMCGAMYPDVFLYFPALLKMMGVSMVCAFNTFLAAINIATAFVSYYSVKSITKSRYTAAIAAVIYTTCTWRLVNMLTRMAIGEALAMIFFPVVIAGLYHILKGDKKKWYILAVGITGVLYSHIISTAVVILFCIIMCIVFYKDTFRKETLMAILKAAALTLAVSLWFLVPFISMYQEDFVAINQSDAFRYSLISPTQLFDVLNIRMGLSYYSTTSDVGIELSQSLGIGVSVCLIVCVVYFIFRKDNRIKDEGYIKALFILGIILLYMSTVWFPWDLVWKIKIVSKFFNSIQFSWRLLSIISAIICVSGSVVIAHYCVTKERKIAVFTAVLAVVFIGVSIYANAYIGKGIWLRQNTSPLTSWANDYNYCGTNISKLYAGVYKSDEFTVTDWEKKGLSIDMTVESKTKGTDGKVEVPLLYYPGYKAVDSNGNKLECLRGTNDVLSIAVPSGYSGTVKIRYKGLAFWKISDIISLMSLLIIIAYVILKKKNKLDYVKAVILSKMKRK